LELTGTRDGGCTGNDGGVGGHGWLEDTNGGKGGGGCAKGKVEWEVAMASKNGERQSRVF